MGVTRQIRQTLKRWWSRLIFYDDIARAEEVRPSLSPEMGRALALWRALYRDRAPWKRPGTVRSLNLAAAAAGEIARQVTMELDWDIRPAGGDGARADFLKAQFAGLTRALRQKLEAGCAAGGMIVKPWPDPATGRIYFDFAMDWSLFPIAFDGEGNLVDVILPDEYRDGEVIYTRLERHRFEAGQVTITQRAFRSTREGCLGRPVPLNSVPRWAALAPEATITGVDGPLFGWFRVAAANSVDGGCPMGASVYARATEVLEQVDLQYSRLLWEFEGGELAVDVDPTALLPRPGGGEALPRLNQRLFRAVDTGAEGTYQVFAPALRDASLINGLNQLLMRFEDLCGLSRGTFSDADRQARTATELRLARQRSYATVADNQRALERCLRDALRAMDRYATLYHLAPEGEWEADFRWDDSVLVDTGAQLEERLRLVAAGALGADELRAWYLGESGERARAAVAALRAGERGSAG